MRHVSVLLKEAIDYLQLKSNQNVVDCTLGDAGHSEIILERIGPKGKLLGIDLDAEAVLRSKRFLYRFEDRAIIVRDNFSNLKAITEKIGFENVSGVLMDLGWSTPQFEERGRGFSFLKDEPLDMRYSVTEKETAADILNSYTEYDLAVILKNFGEEKFNKEIAKAITIYRKNKKIEKTAELTEIILQVYREKLHTDKQIPWIGGIHPVTKVFQALRIAVNHEIENLKISLPQAVDLLESGGRLAVISFHSLEDRIVKQYFKSIAGKKVKLILKKPLVAAEDELKNNPSSRSAKLRVIEKI